jgi:hypothetical protein
MTQRKKEENGLTAWEKVQSRISQIEQKLRQFNNKTPEPSSPEYKQWQPLAMEYINKMDERERLLEPLDNLDKLEFFVRAKIVCLKQAKRIRRMTGQTDEYPADLPDWRKDDYDKARKAAQQLLRKAPDPIQITLTEPVTMSELWTKFKFLESCIDAEKKAAYTDREQKKGENPKSQPAEDAKTKKRPRKWVIPVVVALIGAAAMILVPFINWLLNSHSNKQSISLQKNVSTSLNAETKGNLSPAVVTYGPNSPVKIYQMTGQSDANSEK